MKQQSINALYNVLSQDKMYIPVQGPVQVKGNHEFLVTDKVVVCFFTHPKYEKPFKGVAKLDPTDEFSLETGKKWATTRAHIKFHKRFARDLSKQLEVLEDVYLNEFGNLVKHFNALENLEETLKRLHEEAGGTNAY